MRQLLFPAKRIRAEVIKQYAEENGYRGVVCFSCGNASRALKETGADTLDISPTGDLEARRWFTPAEIRREFPDRLDATSGHIGPDLLNRIAEAFKAYIGELPEEDLAIPTGSGETLVELKIAFPRAKLHAVYNTDSATEYNAAAPLNGLVEALAESISR